MGDDRRNNPGASAQHLTLMTDLDRSLARVVSPLEAALREKGEANHNAAQVADVLIRDFVTALNAAGKPIPYGTTLSCDEVALFATAYRLLIANNGDWELQVRTAFLGRPRQPFAHANDLAAVRRILQRGYEALRRSQ